MYNPFINRDRLKRMRPHAHAGRRRCQDCSKADLVAYRDLRHTPLPEAVDQDAELEAAFDTILADCRNRDTMWSLGREVGFWMPERRPAPREKRMPDPKDQPARRMKVYQKPSDKPVTKMIRNAERMVKDLRRAGLYSRAEEIAARFLAEGDLPPMPTEAEIIAKAGGRTVLV